jgi:hypothetical protein
MMKDTEALDILRAQGYAAGTLDVRAGRVRVWVFGTDESVDVKTGRELHELAEGKLSFDDIRARREDEVPVRSAAAHAAVPHRTSL